MEECDSSSIQDRATKRLAHAESTIHEISYSPYVISDQLEKGPGL